jgi:hypothetical protein
VRDVQTIEAELVEIGAIPDDITKFERLIAWSVSHPDEVSFALQFFGGRSDKMHDWLRKHAQNERS